MREDRKQTIIYSKVIPFKKKKKKQSNTYNLIYKKKTHKHILKMCRNKMQAFIVILFAVLQVQALGE